jgi:hypothetical protein
MTAMRKRYFGKRNEEQDPNDNYLGRLHEVGNDGSDDFQHSVESNLDSEHESWMESLSEEAPVHYEEETAASEDVDVESDDEFNFGDAQEFESHSQHQLKNRNESKGEESLFENDSEDYYLESDELFFESDEELELTFESDEDLELSFESEDLELSIDEDSHSTESKHFDLSGLESEVESQLQEVGSHSEEMLFESDGPIYFEESLHEESKETEEPIYFEESKHEESKESVDPIYFEESKHEESKESEGPIYFEESKHEESKESVEPIYFEESKHDDVDESEELISYGVDDESIPYTDESTFTTAFENDDLKNDYESPEIYEDKEHESKPEHMITQKSGGGNKMSEFNYEKDLKHDCKDEDIIAEFESCQAAKEVEKTITLEEQIRILKARFKIEDLCPNSNVAVGVLLFDESGKVIGVKGGEFFVPSDNDYGDCSDCTSLCVNFTFVIPEKNICDVRKLKIKVITHYTDLPH